MFKMKKEFKVNLPLVLVLLFMSSLNSLVAQPKMDAKAIWKKIEPFFSVPAEYKNQYGKYNSPLKFYDGSPVKTREDWQRRREEILGRWHEMMGVWPPLIKDQEMEITESTRKDGYTLHHIKFYWTRNDQTEGYLLVPDGEGKKPAVITVFYEPETAAGFGRPTPDLDFAYQLTKRGFVTLSIGTKETTNSKTYSLYYPNIENSQVQPLSLLAYAAANSWYVLSKVPEVDSTRIGIMGLSYGGKWAMFASCMFDKFASAVWSDGGIVFDELRSNANYWEPWYLGYYPPPWNHTWRKKGLISEAKGLYPKLIAEGYDLHELHALMAARPFLVSGGSLDTPERWIPLNHTIAVNKLLGFENRVAMTNRLTHLPNSESNEQAYLFLEYFLKYNKISEKSNVKQ